MRTTVTLDPDVERLLREEMRRSGKGFKATLNATLREALAAASGGGFNKKFRLKGPFLGEFRHDFQGVNFNHLADQLEDEALVAKLRKQSGE